MPTNRSRRPRLLRTPNVSTLALDVGLPFPTSILNVKVELLLNGQWVDISTFVYQRDPMVVTRGKPDFTQTIQSAQLTITVNNQDGRFSPRNVNGSYYPYLVRNTQIRISVSSQSITGQSYQGYRFCGEVRTWPQRWDITGTDVYIPLVANGVLSRYSQNSPIGSSLKRYYQLLTGAYVPVAYWPLEEPTTSTSFSSAVSAGFNMTWSGTPGLSSNSDFACSDPLPLMQGSVFSGATGLYSAPGTEAYSTPGLYNWLAQTNSVLVKALGANGGGANGNTGYAGGAGEYSEMTLAVTAGNTYQFYIGQGGQGGQLEVTGKHRSGGDGEDTWFQGDATRNTAHGGDGGTGAGPGAGGFGSTAPVNHPGGFGGGRPHGDQAGGGGGGTGGPSANGNVGQNCSGNTGGNGGAAVTGGFAGGRGGDAPADAHIVNPARAAGGGGAHDPSTGAAHSGANGGPGWMQLIYTPITSPTAVVVRALVEVPASGAANGTILLKINGSSTIDHAELYYGTGGKIGLRAFNAASATLFDTGLQSWSADGALMMVSMEFTPSGANVAYALQVAYIQGSIVSYSSRITGTFAGTMGSVTQVFGNSNGLGTDTAIGHITVQYALIPLTNANLGFALMAHVGERAATRFLRLCSEMNITGRLTGSATDTPLMGPQLNNGLVGLLQECEDADLGQLSELRDVLGLGYRTRISMSNQIPDIVLDYSFFHLSGELVPTDDDQLTRNDVTISRANGGQTRVTLDTGSMSTADPPNGAGRYIYSATINLNTDGQTANMASWVLSLGTLDKTRYPIISVDLSRWEVASFFSIVPALDAGDYMQVQNLPSWLPEPMIKLLLYGFTETIQVTGPWQFDFNTVPEDVYEGTMLTW